MIEIHYTLTLETDAEPGTGLGTEIFDDLVPRDARGAPQFPGSHMKGVLRDGFASCASLRAWPFDLEATIFGESGKDASDGRQGIARFTDATLASARASEPIQQITRTALSESGTVARGSLRTAECVAAGVAFEGIVRLPNGTAAILVDAVRLALLSLTAIGGNRNRGAGQCRIQLRESPHMKPSSLLRSIDQSARAWNLSPLQDAPKTSAPLSSSSLNSDKTALLQLTFCATDPVCCPTVPLTGTNVLRGGFAIPSSAIQGAILHLLNRDDPAVASAVFAHQCFRAWPLLPCALSGATLTDEIPVWTSLTHRMSKQAAGVSAGSDFKDRMVNDYRWQDIPAGAPLKAADGVLIHSNAGVKLWRATDMPRHLSAHVGLNQIEPQLFTVEALAPLVFRGWLAIPEAVVDRLLKLLAASPHMAFGRARGVRGGGQLTATRVDLNALCFNASTPTSVFVVQSPLAIPAEYLSNRDSGIHGGEILEKLVAGSGFGPCARAEATIEFRFGWNRHGLGARVAETNRLNADAVIAAGSVFQLKTPATTLETLLVRGIGGARDRGFGAVAAHPGIAHSLFRGAPSLPTVKSRDKAGALADKLHSLSQAGALSKSAVAQLMALARGGPKHLSDFLDRQKQRPSQSWKRWEPVAKYLHDLASDKSLTDDTRARAFRGWVDAIHAHGDRP